jgi:hypothetical protein
MFQAAVDGQRYLEAVRQAAVEDRRKIVQAAGVGDTVQQKAIELRVR